MDKKRIKAVKKELLSVEKQEKKLAQAAMKTKPAAWKTALEDKIPEKVYSGLESTFSKGFALVFSQGRTLIEKTYNKENLQNNHSIRDYAVQVKGGRKELKALHKSAKRSDGLNIVLTTAEGIALGALGVGMPDIVLFLGALLKGIYETAINYGFDYESRQEQYLILKMMSAALKNGAEWEAENAEVESLLTEDATTVTEDVLKGQMQQTASVFAMDMLLLKFVQGLPVVGIIGGAANPVYYQKVMRYVQVKYRKRYLQRQQKNVEEN